MAARPRAGGKSGHRRAGWWITSTGRDSVLEYDLQNRSFVEGYHIYFSGPKRYYNAMGYRGKLRAAPMPSLRTFDPNRDNSVRAEINFACRTNDAFPAVAVTGRGGASGRSGAGGIVMRV